MRWWEKPLESVKNTSFWYGKPRPLDIEMTSYALLTYLERGESEEALPILRWLMRQRNEMGGFQSTQVSRDATLTDLAPWLVYDVVERWAYMHLNSG